MTEKVNLTPGTGIPTPVAQKTSLTLPLLLILAIFSLAISGYLLWQNQKLAKQLAILQSPPPAPIATLTSPSPIINTPPADPTKGWQTYTNSQYKYSLKYPQGFSINENGMGGGNIEKAESITICGKTSDNIQSPCFAVTRRTDPDTFDNIVGKHYQKLSTNIMTDDEINIASKNLGYPLSKNQIIEPLTKTLLQSLPAYQFTVKGSVVNDGLAEYIVPTEIHNYIWINNSNNFFLISFTKIEVMNQILSTFKFTD